MQDEMRSMSTNGVWDLEKEFLKVSRQLDVNVSTKLNMTPKGMWKDLKRDL